MGLYRNNLSPLPLYESLDEQLHRRSYSYGYVYPLYVHPQSLIPFFFSWEVTPFQYDIESIKQIKIHKKCNCGIIQGEDLLFEDFNRDFNYDFFSAESLSSLGIDIARETRGNKRYLSLYHRGISPFWNLSPGQYYIEFILVSEKHLYSEIFTVISESDLESQTVRISWGDEENLWYNEGFIPYESGYRNTVYLNTKIGKPEYPFEEEGKDRDGYFFPEKQISKKTFRFNAVGTESLYDSMRIIGMSDSIEIRDTLGRIYSPTSFASEIEWLDDGYLAEIQCEFNTDTVIKTVGKPILI